MGNNLKAFLEFSVSGDSTHQGSSTVPTPLDFTIYNYHMAKAWMEWCLGHDYCNTQCPKYNYEDCFHHLIADWEIYLKIKNSKERKNDEQKYTESLPEHSGH